MRRVLQLFGYLVVFVGARGVLFGAPLVLANTMPRASYGMLEWAYATASVIVSVVTIGTANAVPLVAVGISPANVTMRGIWLHHAFIVACSMVALLIAAVLNDSKGIWQVALLTGTLALQGLCSIEHKSAGRANESLLIDAAFFAIAAVAAMAGKVLSLPGLAEVVWGCVGVYSATLAIWLFRKAAASNLIGRWRAEWKACLRAGFPLMLTGILATLVSSSGRLGMGWLTDNNSTAIYSVLSRGAAIPIVAHQVILVARFRKLFSEEADDLENLLLVIIALVALSALLFWSLSPLAGHLLGGAFLQAAQTNHDVLLWLLAQSVLWSAIALNDLVNNRFRTAGIILKWTLPGLLGLIAIGLAIMHETGISVRTFVKVHGAILLAFYVIQSYGMYRQQIPMLRVWAFAAAAYCVLGIGALVA